ncbi:MAG: hypothetical protein QOF65_1027 [Thermoleophilaceae bacterium]|jgi:hypothetical protein|nr:hypothetical protein [Thermoleophilaceae bacterium]
MTRTRRARIALTAALTGAALFTALPGTASAGVLVASAPSCDNGATSQPFAQWGDSNNYFLAPGGNFESGAAGWTLNGARVVADQEPWQVDGGGSHALVVPAGRSVVSPTVCVGVEDPSMRFFAHRSGGGLLGAASQLLVTARVETSLGLVVEVPVGTINALSNGTTWNRTPVQIVLASLLPLLPGEHTPVQFRFAAVGTADWVIDDVFVDPRCRA